MPTCHTQLSSFNHYPVQNCILTRPERYRELLARQKPSIARGQGCSYGDAALNENGQVILTERLNRFLAFDSEQGILTAEAGITLAEILTVIIPHGWFLPITPGTQQVSLGGCVAADVHGKNHHRVGSFSNHVLWLELITADGNTLRCSTKEHADLFRATIGGMGLTGIIGAVSCKLIPIASSHMAVTHHAANNLAQAIAILSNTQTDDDYSVAWIDALASDAKLGRSVIMTAHHASLEELTPDLRAQPLALSARKQLSIPFNCPNWLLTKKTNYFFNQFYYARQIKKALPFITSYQNYFYPLDSIQHWNRLYGNRGFIQYQCVLPAATSQAGMQKILEHLQTTPYPAFLGVLKRFGAQNTGMLSFPMPGFTLALDIPIKDQGLFGVLDQLDEIVVQHGGRIYLAKDARLKPEVFRAMYPAYKEWLTVKNRCDPTHIFSSSLARRLGMEPT